MVHHILETARKRLAVLNREASVCDAAGILANPETPLDEEGRPQGVVHARDLALALIDEVTLEEELLRDYVLGIGYQ